jgi:hypothetical protein
MSSDANSNGLKAVETVRTFLVEMDLNPTEEPFEHGIAFHIELDGPADHGVAQVHTDAERFVFHFLFQGIVPAERRNAVAEFMTRANWGLIEGNYEMNFESGALRFRVGLDFTSTELTGPLVRNAILSGMNNLELSIGWLSQVIDGTLEPEAAWRSASTQPPEA